MRSNLRQFGIQLAFAALRAGIRFPHLHAFQRLLEHQSLIGYLSKLKVNCVIDVGANKGMFAKNIRMAGYSGHIFSFEPILEDFAILSKQAEKDARWKTFNFGLGSEETEASFNIIDDPAGTVFSSFLEPKFSANRSVRKIPIKRLDAIAEQFLAEVPNPVVFLKVDTQGYDMQVVRGASGIIKDIVGLQSVISVTPLYEGMPHYTEALAYYESLGFRLLDLFVVNRDAHGFMLEYDCVMARG